MNFFKCKKILCKSCQWENEDIKLFIFFCLFVQRLWEKFNCILNFDLGCKHIIIRFYLDKKKNKLYFWIQLYHVSFVIYRYKITCRMKKKNKFSVHTHSPRIVSNEILYSKILTLVQWVKIIIQNAYKLYKFLVFGLFLNILLMFCNTPFLGTIYNFSFIFHTRIWLFTEGHFKVWCIFFNVYMRCF